MIRGVAFCVVRQREIFYLRTLISRLIFGVCLVPSNLLGSLIMRILIVDTEILGLDFALRCLSDGHQVRWYRASSTPIRDGEGFKGLQIVDDWRKSMDWVGRTGLVFLTGNSKFLAELDRYRDFGFKIFGPTKASASLEIDRGKGMEAMNACGIDVPPYHTFGSLQEAEAFARKSDKAWVFKPLGDTEDKSLTYVSHDPADLCGWLGRRIRAGQKVKSCMLQEKIDMLCELGVSGWFGPEGFLADKWQIAFEFKKLMPGDIGPNCFTPDAEVLTKLGWKLWPDVTIDDEICTLKDGKIEFERPSQVVIGDFDGELVGWKSPTVDILVTPGHNMYVQDDHYRKPFFFEPAMESFSKTRTIMRAGGVWDGNAGVDESWAALLGAYIADGFCRERSVVFGNCPKHKQKLFSDIAADAGFRANLYGKDLYINSRSLVSKLAPLGKARVPQDVKDSSPSVICAFLRGYGAGDGSSLLNNQIYTTISKGLADDIQELCLKVGLASGITIRDRRGESHDVNGHSCVNRSIAYDIGSGKRTKAEISPSNAYRQKYIGKVYCVTVTSHVIFTRRNGRACWIGQTGEQGTVTQYMGTDKLASDILAPMSGVLGALGHRGDFAVGAGIDKSGKVWPFEFTCYDDQTEVLTKGGWKFFKYTNVGELFATLDPETGAMDYKPATAVLQKEYVGELIHFSGTSNAPDLCVTPDHQMWVRSRPHEKFRFARADAIEAGRANGKNTGVRRLMQVTRTASWVGRDEPVFVLPGRTESHWIGRAQRVHPMEHPPIEMNMMAWLRFLGLYISEGSLGGRHKEARYIVNIAQAHKNHKKIVPLLDGFAIPYTICNNGDFQFASRQLVEHLEGYGLGLCNEKFIPDEFKELAPKYLSALLDGLMAGDGTTHIRGGQRSYSTTSVRLANDVQEIMLKMGYLGRILRRNVAGTAMVINGSEYVRNHDQYIVSERRDKTYGWLDSRTTKRIPYHGKVYCADVPPHHLLYVRRNGNPAWCGNCRTGWPAFMNQIASHEGDVAQWMLDLLDGKDTLKVSRDVCLSVVCGQPPYPANTGPAAVCEGNPISIPDDVWDDVHPCAVMLQRGPKMVDGKVVDGPAYQTTGPYVLVATGAGRTVSKAQKAVYETVKQIKFPNMMYRNDIGNILEKKLPALHKFGYAKDMEF